MSKKTTTSSSEKNPRRKRSRKRGRRRNPWDGSAALTTALGAGVGSLLGAAAGAAVGFGRVAKKVVDAAELPPSPDIASEASAVLTAPLFVLAGSVVGGAIGGHIGAPDKRERMGTLGGSLGGVLGPIGAAIGGAVGGGYAKRRSNPSTGVVAAAVVGSLAAAGAVAYGLKKWRHAAALPPGEPLGGDTPEPGDVPVPTPVPKLYVSAVYDANTNAIRAVVTSGGTVATDGGSVTLQAPALPLDVVVSVPAAFNPIGIVKLGPDATIVAGTPEQTRDIVVRVTKRATTMPSFTFSTEYWVDQNTGKTRPLQVFVR